MPNEILNIQHTIIQLQNVEKVQAVGQQREQYQQKSEAIHRQEEKELEQTVVQISEEAEKVFLQDERHEERGHGKEKKHEMHDNEEEIKDEGDKIRVDIIV